MILDGQIVGRPLISYKDTKTAIEALTGVVAGMTAYATDTNLTGYYTGSSWVWGVGSSGSTILALPQYHFFVGGSSGSAEDAGTGITYNSETNRLSLDNVQWDLTPTPVAPAEGLMYWNADDGTLNLGMPGGDVNLQLGQEMLMRAKNETGSPITNGQLVYISSGTGSNAIVSLAQANAELSSAATIGMATETIANNQFGYITLSGMVRDINTSGSAAGTVLYLSPTVAGAYTGNKPVAPNHLVSIGVIIRSHSTEGVIFVRVDNGFEISELHDVLITSPATNQVLQYNSSGGYWQNSTNTLSIAGNSTINGSFVGNVSGGGSIATTSGQTYTFGTTGGTIPTSAGTLTVSTTNAISAAGSITHAITSSAAITASGASLLSVDANGHLRLFTLSIGAASAASTSKLLVSESVSSSSVLNAVGITRTLTNPTGTSQRAATFSMTGQFTTGAFGGELFGFVANAVIGAANSQAWNGSGGASQAGLVGFYANTQVTSGATGTIGYINSGLFAGAHESANTVTNWILAKIQNPTSTGGGAITNLYGLRIEALTRGGTLNRAIDTAGGQLNFLHNADSTLATFTGHTTFTATTPLVQLTRNDGNTGAVGTVLSLTHNSTGAVTAGFGASIPLNLESASTADQVAGKLEWLWNVATHASAVSDVVLSAAYNSGAAIVASEFLRGRGNAGVIVTGSQTGTYTTTAVDLVLSAIHHWVRVTEAKTITLPTAVGISGREYLITATVNNVIVDAATTELINGSLTQVLMAGDSMQIKSDGAGWKIV